MIGDFERGLLAFNLAPDIGRSDDQWMPGAQRTNVSDESRGT